MKNYYLKRIDELKTDVTSGRPSKSVTTLLRTTAGGFIPKIARKLTKLRLKARKTNSSDKNSSDNGQS